MLLTLVAGLGAGLVLAAPVGPMGVLAAYEAAAHRVKAAGLIGLGGCLADSLLALLATWGAELPVSDKVLHGLLAAVMLGLAGYFLLTAKRATQPLKSTTGFWVSFGSTLLHPANLLAFGLAFKWMEDKGVPIDSYADRLVLVAGVFVGAALVWVGMILLAGWWGTAVSLGTLQARLKQGLAAVCLMTGLWAIFSLL